jgi:hypothetical protein
MALFGEIDFSKDDADSKRQLDSIDRVCGISVSDYTPPKKFQDLKLPALVLKSGLIYILLIIGVFVITSLIYYYINYSKTIHGDLCSTGNRYRETPITKIPEDKIRESPKKRSCSACFSSTR